MPIGIEELSKLETFILNDNKVSRLPNKIGSLTSLKKLFVHNNLLARLPVELWKLARLKEFSSEWFIYMTPPMPKIMRESKG